MTWREEFVIGSAKLGPPRDDQRRADDGEHRWDRQRKTPPVDSACRKDSDGNDGATATTAPQQPTCDAFDDASTVGREAHHDRKVLADPHSRDGGDREHAEPDRVDPAQRGGGSNCGLSRGLWKGGGGRQVARRHAAVPRTRRMYRAYWRRPETRHISLIGSGRSPMNQVASSGVATSSNVPVATSFSALVNFSN